MCRRLFGNHDHQTVVASNNNLAVLYLAQGKYKKAEPLYEEALSMCRRLFGNHDHHDLATTISNLAQIYELQGKYNPAELL